MRGERAGLHEEAHEAEADAVLLLEQFLVAGARVDHRRHVDVVERRQHRGGVLGFLQPLGDRLADARHLDAFFASLAAFPGAGRGPGGGAFASGSRCFRLRRLGPGLRRGAAFLRLGRGDHVVLGQPPVLARAADPGRVDVIFEHRAANRRRQSGDGRVLRRSIGIGDLRSMVVAAQRRGFARPRPDWSWRWPRLRRGGAAAAPRPLRSARSRPRPRHCRLP